MYMSTYIFHISIYTVGMLVYKLDGEVNPRDFCAHVHPRKLYVYTCFFLCVCVCMLPRSGVCIFFQFACESGAGSILLLFVFC